MKLQKAVSALVVLIGFANMALAYEVGEIVENLPSNQVKFYKGELDLKVGETLRTNSNGVKSEIVVQSLQGEYGVGQIVLMSMRPGHQWGSILPGSKLRLEPSHKEYFWGNFNGGTNWASRSGDYGGANYHLGLDVGSYIAKDYFWSLLLQADSYGKDQASTEIRRSAYMLGGGYEYKRWKPAVYLGTIDTMTISAEASRSGETAANGSYKNDKVIHNSEFGYMLSLSYLFWLSEPNRNKSAAFSLSPRVSYASTFGSSDLPGYASIGASVGAWVEDFF